MGPGGSWECLATALPPPPRDILAAAGVLPGQGWVSVNEPHCPEATSLATELCAVGSVEDGEEQEKNVS